MRREYNRKNIYKLLTKGFSVAELRTICMIHFEEVFSELSENSTLTMLVQKLYTHCQSRGLLDELIEALADENPLRFKEFAPYYQDVSTEKEDEIRRKTHSLANSATVDDARMQVTNSGPIRFERPASFQNAAPQKRKILFLAADPKDSRIDLAQEYQEIRREFLEGGQRDAYEWIMPVMAVSFRELMRALSQNPQIVHFSGHGEGDGLYLLDANGFSKKIAAEVLDILFDGLKTITECILLNACHSAEQAKQLSRHGFYVVGYNKAIGDVAARDFAKAFYICISEGNDYLRAARMGLAVLMSVHGISHLSLEVWKDGEQLLGA